MKKLIILFVFVQFAQLSEARRLMIIWEPQDFKFEDTTFYVNQRKTINVNFDFDKASIRPESKPLLDSLILFLKVNPTFTIEVSTHTDSRGNDKYNLKLTEIRVRQIADYLNAGGINEKRFTVRGAGETELLISDKEIKKLKDKHEQEKLHQQNRRTELKITSTSTPLDRSPLLMLSDTWIKPSADKYAFLLGEKITPANYSKFSGFCITNQLNEKLKNESQELSQNKRTYFVYSTPECNFNVLVLVANKPEIEPSLFSSEGKCRVFRYNHCFKSWTEVK